MRLAEPIVPGSGDSSVAGLMVSDGAGLGVRAHRRRGTLGAGAAPRRFPSTGAAVDYLIPMNTQMSARQVNGDIGNGETTQAEQKGPRQIWRKGKWIRQTAKMQARGI